MGNQSIVISGITPISHFPKCPPHHPCTQFCESDKLCIPYQKISRENLREICFKICIHSFKVICTPAGKKLVIDGIKHIKIFFMSDGPHQMIHSADFEIPFCTFVLLKDIQDEVVDVCSVVEDVTVKFHDCKYFTVVSIIFVCPIFKKGNQLSPSPLNHPMDYQPQTNETTHNFECQDKHHCACHTPCEHHGHHSQYDNQQSNSSPSLCKHCQSYSNQ